MLTTNTWKFSPLCNDGINQRNKHDILEDRDSNLAITHAHWKTMTSRKTPHNSRKSRTFVHYLQVEFFKIEKVLNLFAYSEYVNLWGRV